MRFHILGALEVCAETGRVPLGGPGDRRILAALLLDAGHTVAIARLVDAAWDDPPPSAVKSVRNAVSRLRAAVGAQRIEGESAGYRIRVADGELDAQAFDGAVAQAKRCLSGGDPAQAGELLASALALWRGPALSGIGSRILEGVAASWDERRVAARELLAECEITLGRYADAVPDLTALVNEQPLRERPVALLMRALSLHGRTAEALAAFAALRNRLADELGLDPGAELRELHQRILTGEPSGATVAVAVQAPAVAVHRPDTRVPRQLPPGIGHFVGRVGELKALDSLASETAPGGAVVISAIDGTAGVGKTALALHWAHRAAAQYPDGQLFADLRGFDPSGRPVDPHEAVRGFLGALDVRPSDIPMAADAQTALYRSILVGRRVLIVLDNARDADQVRPLLPASPTCTVLITSRARLTGLIVAHGAQPLPVGLMTDAEAHDLLSRRLGARRTADEPEAARDLVDQCARLPLALNIVCARAAVDPAVALPELAADLREAHARLTALGTGDSLTDVRSVFSWSYHALDDTAARMFRLIGIHPGPDISAQAAAALTGVTLAEARRTLAELVRSNLLMQHVAGRFAFHDLLRAYAMELAHSQDAHAERTEACRRMLDYYLFSADAAGRAVEPVGDRPPLPECAAGVTPESFADAGAAVPWMESEHRVLVACVSLAADSAFPVHVYRLAWLLSPFLLRMGSLDAAASCQTIAMRVADRHGDLAEQARAHERLSHAAIRSASWPDADRHMRSAIELHRRLGDLRRASAARQSLAWILGEQGHHREALELVRQVLDTAVDLGDRTREAHALNGLGWYLLKLDRPQEALAYCSRAVSLLRELGERDGEGDAWDSLGHIHRRLAQHAQALRSYQRALDVFNELGDRYSQAVTLRNLGDVHEETGDVRSSRQAWRAALAIFDGLRHPEAEKIRGRLGRASRPDG